MGKPPATGAENPKQGCGFSRGCDIVAADFVGVRENPLN
jgi:hypothetical protein